jgi:cellulose synthase operon protein B
MRNILVILLMTGQVFGSIHTGFGNNSIGGQLKSNQTTSENPDLGNIFTLNQLGFTDKIMVGPYETANILFSLPSTWQLTSNGTITLHYNFVGGTINNVPLNQVGTAVGTLTVYFNNVVVDNILLNQSGDMTVLMSIPDNALQPAQQDGRYNLSFFFDASVNCNNTNIASTLVISSSSELNLQHQILPPPTDLSNFPRPIYQPQSIAPTATTIVVPDQPSVNEIQAALAVAAGLGSLTNGELSTDLIPVSKLPDNTRNLNNLIFVGLVSKFSILAGTVLPIPISNDKLVVNGSNQNDGIIQMAVSPWNPGNVILLVSGNTDDAVLKAGKAIGVGHLVTSGRPDVSLISEVNPTNSEGIIAEDRTLADLGYGNQTLGSSFSGQYLDYLFPALPEQASSTDSYLDITTLHSDLLNLEKSGVSLFLNGSVVGSINFTQSADQLTTTRIKLLPNMLHRGENRLEIVSDLTPIYNCYSQNLASTWVTISGSSVIHLPIGSQVVDLGKSLDLKNYPSIFLTDRNLTDLGFVLPQNDPTAWDYAAKVAYYLGFKGSIPLANMQAAYGNDVPDGMRNQQSLLIFGRASTLPIITELKDVLPAPFPQGSDEATQPALLVNYHLLPGIDVGYIELMISPWNPNRAILAVMGNTVQGIPLAGQALVTDASIAKLNGDFSIVYGAQILTTDTRLGPSTGQLIGGLPVVITAVPTAVNTQNVIQQSQIIGRAGWVLPAILFISILVILTLVIIFRNTFKGRIS